MGGRRHAADRDDPFPTLVTLGCLCLGLLLYVHSTRPALEEREHLDQVEDQIIGQMHLRGEQERQEKRRLQDIHRSPEGLIHELDRLGIAPNRVGALADQQLAEDAERAAKARAAETGDAAAADGAAGALGPR